MNSRRRVKNVRRLNSIMPKKPDMKKLKAQMGALAERIAHEGFKTKLDYSIDSIKQVDSILDAIHKDYKKTRSEDGLQGIALEFGAYIVKVIEQHFGPAEWERDDPSFGKDTFPLRWRDTTIFPVGWCLKRILNGPGDDVWSKFQTLVLNHQANQH
jgi:hypothetical protein